MKAYELRPKSKVELQGQVRSCVCCKAVQGSSEETSYLNYSPVQLKELKQELGALRVAKVTGGAPNKLSKM